MKLELKRLVVLLVTSACAAVTYSAHAQDPNGYLYIAHAAAGRNISSATNPAYPVDISIGGRCIVQGLSFGEIRGPFTEPAGSYAVLVSVANSGDPCSNPAVFSAGIGLTAGSASLGVVSVNSAHQVSGSISPIDLSAVSTTAARVLVANMTTDNLTATITAGDDTTSSPASASFAPNSFTSVSAIVGEFTLNVYPQGSTAIALGPMELDLVARNVYLLAFAGSVADGSVQLVGPLVIKDVF